VAAKSLRGNRGSAPATIVIRRDEGEEPAHHGGAWKVAYADFVTAMMAFFMLMWLLNATTEVQRTGLADYFAPTNLFGRSASGSGKPFGGRTPNEVGTSASTDGIPKVINGRQSPQPDVEEEPTETPAQPDVPLDPQADSQPDVPTASRIAAGPADADGLQRTSPDGQRVGSASQPAPGDQAVVHGGDYAAASATPPPPGGTAAEIVRREAAAVKSDAQREQRALDQAGAQLLDAVRQDPALKDTASQIIIDNVPEGLRIQIVDAERQPMFALGSGSPTLRVRALMQKVVPALASLPNAISIAGHTDSLTYRGQEKGNWELSADRANASRRILTEAGLGDERIRSVTGNADRDLLVPTDPQNPVNRRITIIVLRHAVATKAITLATPGTVTP
jgi:chemotaxis protein MotB